MIPPEYIELMNGEIDGANSDADSRRLRDFLAESPEAAAHFRELREAVEAVGGVTLLEPPPGLRQRILRAVDAEAEPRIAGTAPGADASPGGLRAVWRQLRGRPDPRLAFAAGFAFALLAAAVVWQTMLPSPSVAPEDLRGTILHRFEAAGGVRGEPVTATLDGVTVTAQSHRAETRTLVRLTVAGGGATVRLVATASIGCEFFSANPPAWVAITAAERQLTLDLPDAGEFDLVLRHSDSTAPAIDLQLLEGAAVRVQKPIARRID